MSVQPVDADVERDEHDEHDELSERLDGLVALASAIVRAQEERPAPVVPPEEDPTGPQFTLTYRTRRNGKYADVTVDLDEVPDEKLPKRVRRWRPAQRYAAVEDIRDMVRQGENMTGVCARLTALREHKVTPKAVERFLHRYGAHDLVWQLKASELDGEVAAPDSPDWYHERYAGKKRAGLTPEEVEVLRRKWNEGPEDGNLPTLARYDALPTPPTRRVLRGHAVTGRRLA